MSVFKKFKSSDIIVVPFETNKGYSYIDVNNNFEDNQIFKYEGKNEFIDLFNPVYSLTTNQIPKKNIYDSIKHLYFSNHINSTYNDSVNLPIEIPTSDGITFELIGSSSSQGRYENYSQTDLTYPILFPTGTNDIIGVLSIPKNLYGDYIKPNSFNYSFLNETIFDDGEGNIIKQSNNTIVGRIIYSHGMILITSDGEIPSIYGTSLYGISVYTSNNNGPGYNQATYGIITYGQTNVGFIYNFLNETGTLNFSSSLTIFDTQYRCNVKENEFNYSFNKSLLNNTGSFEFKNFVNSNYFNVYATTIGLYNDNQELLAVAKLAQPVKLSKNFETNFIINIDR